MYAHSIACMVVGALVAATESAVEDTMLAVGTEAPGFSLVSDRGDTVTLGSFRGKSHVVLIFYPGDQTPGCTKQLCAVRDDFAQFSAKGAVVFGINPADKESHRLFAQKQGYQFPLLVDEGKRVAAAYGAKGLMVKRTVFVVDRNGKIAYAKRGMPPDAEILAAITTDGKP